MAWGSVPSTEEPLATLQRPTPNADRPESGEAAVQDSLGRSPRNGKKRGGLALKAREKNKYFLCVYHWSHPRQNISNLPKLLDHVHPHSGARHKRISSVLRRYGEAFDEQYGLD
jgi:hypothetical protein